MRKQGKIANHKRQFRKYKKEILSLGLQPASYSGAPIFKSFERFIANKSDFGLDFALDQLMRSALSPGIKELIIKHACE